MEKKIKKFGELNDGDFVYFVYNGKFRSVSTNIVAQIVRVGRSNVVFDSIVDQDHVSETFPARFNNDIEVYVTTSFQDAMDKFEEITGEAPHEVIMDVDNGMRMPVQKFKKMLCPTEEEHKAAGTPSKIEEFLFGLVGVFNHYDFFTKELWRKAPGFRNKDEAEVKCAFMHKWRNEEFGGYTSTCGCDWFDEVSKESFDSYIREYEPVFEMYREWMEEQR